MTRQAGLQVTPSAGLSRLSDGPVYTAATFPAAGLSSCESLVFTPVGSLRCGRVLKMFMRCFYSLICDLTANKHGLKEEATTNGIQDESSQNREARVQQSCFLRSLILQLD